MFTRRIWLASLAASVLVMTAAASTAATPAPTKEQLQAAFNAHKGDFDYLLGSWSFTGTNRTRGAFIGRWQAARLRDGVVVDEYRVVNDKGETIYSTETIRSYNAARDRWELVSLGAGGGLQDIGSGRRDGDQVVLEQTFGAAFGSGSTWRIRYSDIKPDGFHWSADVSQDGGKTWTKDFQTLDVHRVAEAPPQYELFPAPASAGK